MTMKLYSWDISPYAARVRMQIYAKGLTEIATEQTPFYLTQKVYEERPDTCRRFPHLVRGNGSIASRMWQFIDRACYCPIVYNALEAFKVETRFRR